MRIKQLLCCWLYRHKRSNEYEMQRAKKYRQTSSPSDRIHGPRISNQDLQAQDLLKPI
jgi:very-short-patch-repair endonuclease